MFKTDCKIEYSAECDYIIGKDNNIWMQISTAGNEVVLKIFPRNIPKEFIGEKAQERAELTYTLICETQEAALNCRRYLADFIDSGYGEKWYTGDGWLLAMDFQDITDVLTDKMRYSEFKCDNKEVSTTFLNFFEESNLKDAKSILLCVYIASYEKNTLIGYNEITEKLHEATSKNCVIMQQCLVDKIIENNTAVRILYS